MSLSKIMSYIFSSFFTLYLLTFSTLDIWWLQNVQLLLIHFVPKNLSIFNEIQLLYVSFSLSFSTEMAPPTISIHTATTWIGQQIDYSITINGSVKVAAGGELELSCRHSLYKANNLEWFTSSHTYPNFRNSLQEDALKNITVAHLGFPEAARQYSGRYTCRIKNTTIFHFVDIIIFWFAFWE